MGGRGLLRLPAKDALVLVCCIALLDFSHPRGLSPTVTVIMKELMLSLSWRS